MLSPFEISGHPAGCVVSPGHRTHRILLDVINFRSRHLKINVDNESDFRYPDDS